MSRLWAQRAVARDYLTAISGSAGRLVFSLIYFVALANTLTIAEFGLFATASAAGVMLSRILGFGFTAPLYRVATVRPRLIGIFAGGFLMMGALSLPVLALSSALVFALFFGGDLNPIIFAEIVIAEALLWRPAETIVIVNNGMNRFGRASLLVILGTVLRAAAAGMFALTAAGHGLALAEWVHFYLAANAAALLIAILVFTPPMRLQIRPRYYWKRLPDALYVAGAELLFYLQMEFDKLLVLSLGGAELAGIYAILMRLVDLTAIPIRTFTMMLVQRLMRLPDMMKRWRVRIGLEAGVFLLSTAALFVLALILAVAPNALGSNVAAAAGLVMLALAIPGFRNLTEYHSELLFARGQTLRRAINLLILTGAKLAILTVLIAEAADPAILTLWLNGGFALLYGISAVLTYTALRKPAKLI
ncbi:lipopolysaccharide biosynthesis protein [Tianweitania sp. BSSL-BM11]|uniref:Lipopolysaccharide biosynthesis protein n=1 Tax=Tianweitania aestuarii TaxID=2814886 RepID=A0ABS5RQU3_9HYPH|nr:lipopolysaccharide biosynthesis protein [Tianweitania aestuarii]